MIGEYVKILIAVEWGVRCLDERELWLVRRFFFASSPKTPMWFHSECEELKARADHG